MDFAFVWKSFIAGILASIACGLGALPLFISPSKIHEKIGLGYSFAGGLMFAASVYNLLMPAFTIGGKEAHGFENSFKVLGGMALGCYFIHLVEKYLTEERLASKFLKPIGGKREILIFLAMCFHSVPEGIAVGVGYGSEAHLPQSDLGIYIAIAIAIHNVPEGLAVALPLKLKGEGFNKCFWLAFLTSLPQPLASVPASLLVWLFYPLMLPLLGFAAGAMMYLVILELVPDALETRSRTETASAFMLGFGTMALIQIGL
ncbi:MAG: ZIP family metal transporter [Planctomycetota bacterium]|nr:MAG: ZIP family metal transporter [Planctomycetota bacterium]